MVRSLTRALPSLTMALMFILLGTGFFAMESGAAWTFFAGVGALLVGLTDLAKLAYLAFCEHRTEARRSGLPSRF